MVRLASTSDMTDNDRTKREAITMNQKTEDPENTVSTENRIENTTESTDKK